MAAGTATLYVSACCIGGGACATCGTPVARRRGWTSGARGGPSARACDSLSVRHRERAIGADRGGAIASKRTATVAASQARLSRPGESGSGDERSESGRKAPAGWGGNCFGPDIPKSGPIINAVHTHRLGALARKVTMDVRWVVRRNHPHRSIRSLEFEVSRPMESRDKEAEYGSLCGGLRNFGCDRAAVRAQSRRSPTAHGCSCQA